MCSRPKEPRADRGRVQDRGREARRAAANAQCPLPREDKTVAVNAQIDAEAFNRKMGANLHAVPANDFPGRREGAAADPARRELRADR